jgi:hypothetical protein
MMLRSVIKGLILLLIIGMAHTALAKTKHHHSTPMVDICRTFNLKIKVSDAYPSIYYPSKEYSKELMILGMPRCKNYHADKNHPEAYAVVTATLSKDQENPYDKAMCAVTVKGKVLSCTRKNVFNDKSDLMANLQNNLQKELNK